MMGQRSAIVEPRGLRRPEAAHYVGVSPSHFDKLVEDQTFPSPKRAGNCKVWDRRQLDRAFDCLPQDREERNEQNPFDNIKLRGSH